MTNNNNYYLLVLDLGSRGPSTVTFIALDSVATWGGDVCSIIVSVKLFPEKNFSQLLAIRRLDLSTKYCTKFMIIFFKLFFVRNIFTEDQES